MKQNIYWTIYCGLVNENLVDQEIKIAGWIENIRDHGGVIFVDVRDEKGTVQVVSNEENLFDNLTKESTVTITSIVRKKNEEDYNKAVKNIIVEEKKRLEETA